MRKRHPFLTGCGIVLIVLLCAGAITALIGIPLGWYKAEEEVTEVEGEGEGEAAGIEDLRVTADDNVVGNLLQFED